MTSDSLMWLGLLFLAAHAIAAFITASRDYRWVRREEYRRRFKRRHWRDYD